MMLSVAQSVMFSTVAIWFITYLFLYHNTQKIIYSAFVFFYYLYSGYSIHIGRGVHSDYYSLYIGLLVSTSLSFILFSKLMRREALVLEKVSVRFFKNITNYKVVMNIFIAWYIGSMLLYLIFPEFKLDRLINPPKPDVTEQFVARIAKVRSGGAGAIEKLVDYSVFLSYPLYLIAISIYRRKPFILFFLLFLPLYFHYCSLSYINRGKVLETLFLFTAMLWYYTPKLRKFVIIGSCIILPLLPSMLMNYSAVRLGYKAKKWTTVDAMSAIIEAETIMPRMSYIIFENERRINLKDYFVWMATLPIPKAVFGQVNRVSAGVEMSEILLNKKYGEEGYFALLAGLVNEAKYTFGKNMSFIHGIFIAFFMAFAARITQRNDYLFPVLIVFTVVWSYNLNRAGISSSLPIFTNKFLSIYLILFVLYFLNKVGINSIVLAKRK